MVARVARQIVAVRLLAKNETACSVAYRRSVGTKQLLWLFQRDGLDKRAGDGARTRDSLLGRQELYH
jgi:hypothetical protein